VDGEVVILTRRIHQLLEMAVVVLRWWPGRRSHGSDFSFLDVRGAVVPLESVGVLLSIPPFTVGFASIAQAFFHAKKHPHCVFPVNELCHDVKEVGGRLWLPPSELMD
jgi:hypothetical protein